MGLASRGHLALSLFPRAGTLGRLPQKGRRQGGWRVEVGRDRIEATNLLLQQLRDEVVIGSRSSSGLSVVANHDIKCMLDVRQNGVGARRAQLLGFISEEQLNIL